METLIKLFIQINRWRAKMLFTRDKEQSRRAGAPKFDLFNNHFTPDLFPRHFPIETFAEVGEE